ncbi:MAG: ankyrin repeat domain-containing protein [Sphingopyxis sp.]|jgi:ankyrin repeat protein|nr:ankyrin repeat domain-containing protein [Sphingopyxis sp.]
MLPALPLRFRTIAIAVAAAVIVPPLALVAAAPATAQLMSPSFRFLEAVRDRDGQEVQDMLSQNPLLINTRDVSTGKTALMIVVERRDTTWLRFLLQRGADANAADRSGLTPILSAAQGGFVDGIQPLIDRGARINASNASGETPLHFAVQRRDLAMVRVLIAAGADPELTDNVTGRSPRDYARQDSRAGAILEALNAPRPRSAPVTGPVIAGPN